MSSDHHHTPPEEKRIRDAALDLTIKRHFLCCYRNADPSSRLHTQIETRRRFAGQDERADCFGSARSSHAGSARVPTRSWQVR
jgi:hypothetical protein